MNNELYKQIWNRIQECKKVTIFTHVNPDGDTIGTSVALRELIKLNLPGIEVKISGDKYPYNLNLLPSNDEVSDEYIENSLAILVDGSSIKRTFDKRILNAKEIIKIDHHHPEGDEWSIAIEGDKYPAAGEIIYEMVKFLELEVNEVALRGMFVAIWTDTSGLIERNPSIQTFDAIHWIEYKGIDRDTTLEAMELNEEDKMMIKDLTSEVVIEDNVALKINELVVSNTVYRPATEKFFKDNEVEAYVFATRLNDGLYRVGLRSKGYDVSKVAENHNGGGHVTSSGCVTKTKDEIIEIFNFIKGDLNENN